MPRLDTVLVLLLAMPAATFATAQPVRNTMDRNADHRQLAVDRDWSERDAREVQEFEQMTTALKDACHDRMSARYREVSANLQKAMDREIEQAGVRSAQAAHEAALSRREFRNERMEAGASGSTRESLQAIDDGHDLRDDARDQDTAMTRHEAMIRIGTLSGALQNDIGRGNRAAMKRNAALADEFLSVMRRDLAATRHETVEDRAELREDRRETRTDRR